MKEEIINKIKSLGLDDEKAQEVYQILSEEILDDLLSRLLEETTEEEFASIESRIMNSKSKEHLETIIYELALTVYGDNAKETIKEMYFDTIKSIKQSIKDANDLINKANSGDPKAQELIEKAKQSDTYKNIMSENS